MGIVITYSKFKVIMATTIIIDPNYLLILKMIQLFNDIKGNFMIFVINPWHTYDKHTYVCMETKLYQRNLLNILNILFLKIKQYIKKAKLFFAIFIKFTI